MEDILNLPYTDNTEELPEHKLLETYFSLFTDRVTANKACHRLLLRFDDLGGILDADEEILSRDGSVTAEIIAAIRLLSKLIDNAQKDRNKFVPDFTCFEDIGDYLLNQYMGYTTEKAGILFLNSAGKFLGFSFISDGSLDSVKFSIKELIDLCIEKKATDFVLCHNHPNGIALPSSNDVVFTEKISEIFKGLSVNFLDHVIIGKGDYISMAQSKEYTHLFTRNKDTVQKI